MKKSIAILAFISIFAGCEEESVAVERGEYITRSSKDKTEIPPPTVQPSPAYPWDKD